MAFVRVQLATRFGQANGFLIHFIQLTFQFVVVMSPSLVENRAGERQWLAAQKSKRFQAPLLEFRNFIGMLVRIATGHEDRYSVAVDAAALSKTHGLHLSSQRNPPGPTHVLRWCSLYVCQKFAHP